MNTIEVLVVAGGGRGGGGGGGGGGAGGLLYEAAHPVIVKEYQVKVGGGESYYYYTSVPAQDSVFDTLIAKAGGRGAGRSSNLSSIGGSGGGGAWYNLDAAYGLGSAGIGGQGHKGGDHTGAGGDSDFSSCAGAGGGGAGENGHENALVVAGNGGDGVECSISGAPVWYAGGGGGGVWQNGDQNNAGAGGRGGGGHGTKFQGTNGSGGTPNTGGGGGGEVYNGGSGIVIIRYHTGSLLGVGGVITVDGLDTIHTFTESGYFTVFLPMPSAINIADAWKQLKWSSSKLNVAHAWRAISALYINEGDMWKQIYPLFLMLEDRSHVLLESGDKIIMEDQ